MDTNAFLFEAAVSANEEEAYFLTLSISYWFGRADRFSWRARLVFSRRMGRPLRADFHLWKHWSNNRLVLLTGDYEFIPVDFVKVLNILLVESSEKLQCLFIKSMGSLTRRAKLAVSLQEVQADVELFAGGGESAGAKLTITFVVMWTNPNVQLPATRYLHRCNPSHRVHSPAFFWQSLRLVFATTRLSGLMKFPLVIGCFPSLIAITPSSKRTERSSATPKPSSSSCSKSKHPWFSHRT